MDRGVLDFFLREKDTLRSYRGEQFIAGNKTKKSSDKPPTDLEHRPGDRADQAYYSQLTARNIFFGCLIFGEDHKSNFVFVCCCTSVKL